MFWKHRPLIATHTHTHAHTRTHTHAHTRTHALTHTHTHSRMYSTMHAIIVCEMYTSKSDRSSYFWVHFIHKIHKSYSPVGFFLKSTSISITCPEYIFRADDRNAAHSRDGSGPMRFTDSNLRYDIIISCHGKDEMNHFPENKKHNIAVALFYLFITNMARCFSLVPSFCCWSLPTRE
jgi:hypothetical protein